MSDSQGKAAPVSSAQLGQTAQSFSQVSQGAVQSAPTGHPQQHTPMQHPFVQQTQQMPNQQQVPQQQQMPSQQHLPQQQHPTMQQSYQLGNYQAPQQQMQHAMQYQQFQPQQSITTVNQLPVHMQPQTFANKTGMVNFQRPERVLMYLSKVGNSPLPEDELKKARRFHDTNTFSQFVNLLQLPIQLICMMRARQNPQLTAVYMRRGRASLLSAIFFAIYAHYSCKSFAKQLDARYTWMFSTFNLIDNIKDILKEKAKTYPEQVNLIAQTYNMDYQSFINIHAPPQQSVYPQQQMGHMPIQPMQGMPGEQGPSLQQPQMAFGQDSSQPQQFQQQQQAGQPVPKDSPYF